LVIYLDSAALVKLVREEEETRALVTWLNERAGERLVASVLVDVEVPRALRRSQPGVLGAVAATLARIDRIEFDAAVRATAAAYVDPQLRSLDAIHLATADQLVASGKTVSAFVTYDRRLAVAASASSFPVVSPGTALG
jgi:predicted nucleic acid-binding protein